MRFAKNEIFFMNNFGIYIYIVWCAGHEGLGFGYFAGLDWGNILCNDERLILQKGIRENHSLRGRARGRCLILFSMYAVEQLIRKNCIFK